MKHIEEYRDAAIAKSISEQIRQISKRSIRLMEVCGTHTMSIFRNGIRSLLPDTVTLLSGPGCPVCVTAQKEIDAFIALSQTDGVILTTFGDLLRVPGTVSSLQKERANGRDIRMVYSAFDALKIAEKHPDKEIVFPGVGFETTAPTIAATIISAADMGIKNFSVYSAHKLVPPALFALTASDRVRIDGFILPGHVSVIIGIKAYLPLFHRYRIPSVAAGFEPADMLQAIYRLAHQIEFNTPCVENAYPRAVSFDGNPKALQTMNTVFEETDAAWRGLGIIPKSGLKIRKDFASFDAEHKFQIAAPPSEEPKGCLCGEILTGVMTPPECPLYKTVCTPMDPVGPCMVSSEGTCAAYYKFQT